MQTWNESYPVDLEEVAELSDVWLSTLEPLEKVDPFSAGLWTTFMWLHFRPLNTSLSRACVKWGYFLFLAGWNSRDKNLFMFDTIRNFLDSGKPNIYL